MQNQRNLFKSKWLRNLTIALVVADGVGIYVANSRLNKPAVNPDAAYDDAGIAATQDFRFVPDGGDVAAGLPSPSLARSQAPTAAVPPVAKPAARAPSPREPSVARLVLASAPVRTVAPVIAPAKLPAARLASPLPPAPWVAAAPARPSTREFAHNAVAAPVRPGPADPAIRAQGPAKDVAPARALSLSTVLSPETRSSRAAPHRATEPKQSAFNGAFNGMAADGADPVLSSPSAGLIVAPDLSAPTVRFQAAPGDGASGQPPLLPVIEFGLPAPSSAPSAAPESGPAPAADAPVEQTAPETLRS